MAYLIIPRLFISIYLSGPALSVPSPFKGTGPHYPEQNLSTTVKTQNDIQIDPGSITAFATTLKDDGEIYIALCTPESLLKIYLSEDGGVYWRELLRFPLSDQAKYIELLKGKGDSSHLFVFYLTQKDNGDLWLLRIKPDLSEWQNIPLAVGPDTVDRFTVAIDNKVNYYLYCLYVNQRRGGRNGRFTRSLDYGLTWEMEQDFYNTFDPHLFLGANTVLHCIWRFAINGREIHYTQNRYYGAPARWSGLQVLYATGEKCFDPKVVQADTSPPWRAPIWTVWTVARRDTEMLDLVYTISTDGGNTFSPPANLGEIFIDEWWPSLLTYQGSAYLVYNTGSRSPDGQTSVYYRHSRDYTPQIWSSPVRMNDRRANALFYGARPRALPNAALFCYYGHNWAKGLYFNRAIPSMQVKPQRRFNLGTGSEAVFDITGRQVPFGYQKIKSGIYFVRKEGRLQKLLVW